MFADDNFKFHVNGEKISKWVENTVGKGEIARYEQFPLFPQCFQKIYFRQVKQGLACERTVQYINEMHLNPLLSEHC